MLKSILDFISKNFKTIVQVCFGIFLLYWLIFFLTPSVKMNEKSVKKLDSLNSLIKDVEVEQKKLDSLIVSYDEEVDKIELKIDKIKEQKTIIKEYYHEKIITIDAYGRKQLDSFFSKRYQY